MSENTKAVKTLNDCWCGCGGKTAGRFVPGHDARFHGLAKKIARGVVDRKDLPTFPHAEAEADFWKHVEAEKPLWAAKQAVKVAEKAAKARKAAEKAAEKSLVAAANLAPANGEGDETVSFEDMTSNVG